MPSTQITMDLTHYISSDVWDDELFLILSLFCELDALSLFLLILMSALMSFEKMFSR